MFRALAADDPPLEVVGRELDDRDRRLRGVARRDALERVGDERSGAPPCVGARLLLHLPHLARELVPDEVLRAVEKLLARLVDGQARDLLECRERVPLRVAELLLERLDVDLAISEPLLSPLELRETGVDVELLLEDALLDLRDLDAPILDLALDLAAKRDRLLARFDLRLAPKRLGLALRVAEQLLALAPARLRTRDRDQPSEDDGRREQLRRGFR